MAFRFAAHLRAQLKSSARLNGLRVAASGLLVLTPVAATQTFANPLGATVTTGSAAISDPSSQQMTIEQRSEDVVIDWQSFNIANGQTTQFVQPNAQAIAVNRIGGARASQIVGTLDANGRIVLINGNGILFARGSQVNVNSLVATYTDNTDSDVLAGSFSQAGNQNASIVNQGSIGSWRSSRPTSRMPVRSMQDLEPCLWPPQTSSLLTSRATDSCHLQPRAT
jgi:filamentous hemagglutinin family protein